MTNKKGGLLTFAGQAATAAAEATDSLFAIHRKSKIQGLSAIYWLVIMPDNFIPGL
jgi:hypothetical protein